MLEVGEAEEGAVGGEGAGVGGDGDVLGGVGIEGDVVGGWLGGGRLLVVGGDGG